MFAHNIEKATLSNTHYRKVIHTNKYQQEVLMCLNPGEDIPMEKHEGSQFIRVESGRGVITTPKGRKLLHDGVSVMIGPGVQHYVRNTSDRPLKLYAIYSPPEHPPGTIQRRQ